MVLSQTDLRDRYIMLAALLAVAPAFSPIAPAPAMRPATCRAAAPCASLSSRRAAVSTGASLAALAMLPRRARAEDTEDAIARIVAKNKIAQEKERDEIKAKIAQNTGKVEKENAGATILIGGIGVAGLVFSFPFFYKNVARLLLRWRSVVDKSITEDMYVGDTTTRTPNATMP